MKKVLYSLLFCLGNIMAANLIIPNDILRQIHKQTVPKAKNIHYYKQYYENHKNTEAGPITANLIWQGYHAMGDKEKKSRNKYFKIFLSSFYDDEGRLLNEETISNKLLGLPNAVYNAWLTLAGKYQENVLALLEDLLNNDELLDDLLRNLNIL